MNSAATWLQAIDAFLLAPMGKRSEIQCPRLPIYERRHVIMYAFGIEASKTRPGVQVTHLTDHNYWPDESARTDYSLCLWGRALG